MATETRATIRWERELVFAGRTPRGYDLDFDESAEWGLTPVEALLLSVGGCMAMDIVAILGKMRCPPSGFAMELAGERAEEPPRYFTRMRLDIEVAGEGVTEEKVDRAIRLSRETYCSVLHSLRPDLELEIRRRVGEPS
jgi:putative redox protein